MVRYASSLVSKAINLFYKYFLEVQDSQPYTIRESKTVLYRCIFVYRVTIRFFQMVSRFVVAAFAVSIVILISLSLFPYLDIVDPRYLNSTTVSRPSPPVFKTAVKLQKLTQTAVDQVKLQLIFSIKLSFLTAVKLLTNKLSFLTIFTINLVF